MSTLRDRAAENPLVRFAYKARVLAQERESVRTRPRESARFLFRGREVTNFTYEIENMDDLAGFVAESTGRGAADVDAAIRELAEDDALTDEIRRTLTTNPRRESEPLFGYRRASHAITRLIEPKRVVEIGTHDGLGAAAIAAALARNAEEGSPGVLHTLDINPDAGWLVPERLGEFTKLRVGPVTETLPAVLAEEPPEFVFHDVGHAFEHQQFIFDQTLAATRGRKLLLMGEVDISTDLPSLCEREGAPYICFTERPRNHFWHGHTWGLGIFGA